MRRGEVWLYEEPDEKRRPALIVSRNEDIDRLITLNSARMTEVCRILARATSC